MRKRLGTLARASLYRATTAGLPLLTRLPSSKSRDTISMVMLHGVHEDSQPDLPHIPSSSTAFSVFESNIRTMQRSYNFISLDLAVEMLEGKVPWKNNCIVLTFDDSLMCFSKCVAPALARWEIPATFYISTDILNHRQCYWWLRVDYALNKSFEQSRPLELRSDTFNWRYDQEDHEQSIETLKRTLMRLPVDIRDPLVDNLEHQANSQLDDDFTDYPYAEPLDWDGAKKILQCGMTIGGHTLSHANLPSISPADVKTELTKSKELIEHELQIECDHFCYPYGLHSDSVKEAVREAGYRSAVTTEVPGWNQIGDDLFSLRRFFVPKVHYKMPYLVYGIENKIQNLRKKWLS